MYMRHKPCHILQDSGIPCVVWFEDAIAHYGVPTVVFDLYILVPDIDTASNALISHGWTLSPRQTPKIGNAHVSNAERCMLPPPDEPVSTTCSGPTITILLSAADWCFSLEKQTERMGNLDYSFYPPLPELLDALIRSTLDCHMDSEIRRHLNMQIAYLYGTVPELQERSFADLLIYEHRQYHADVVSGMSAFKAPFDVHERRVREELRQGKRELSECSATRDNELLFNNAVQARLLAAMPKPVHADFEDREDTEGEDESWSDDEAESISNARPATAMHAKSWCSAM